MQHSHPLWCKIGGSPVAYLMDFNLMDIPSHPFSSSQAVVACLEGLAADLQAAGLSASSYPAAALEGLLFQGLASQLGSSATCLAAARHHAGLARLLRDVAPATVPSVAASTQTWPDVGVASAPVHLPVQKDGVRLQASGEAAFTGDLAAANSRQLYAAGARRGCTRVRGRGGEHHMLHCVHYAH